MGCVQYRNVCKRFAKFPIFSTRLLLNAAMDYPAADPSCLDGEGSRGAGSVYYIIRYFSLTEKAPVRFAPEPLSSAKKKTRNFRDRLTWRMNHGFICLCVSLLFGNQFTARRDISRHVAAYEFGLDAEVRVLAGRVSDH